MQKAFAILRMILFAVSTAGGRLRVFRAAAVCCFPLIVLLTLSPSLHAQTTIYSWDADGGGAGTGGTGDWGNAAANTNWTTNGTTFFLWSDIPSQADAIASFGGTAGTVSLRASFLVNSVEFLTTGYTLQSSTNTSRTITNSAGNVTVGSGLTASMGNAIRFGGSSGFTKLGDGTLVLGNTANTTSGNNTVSAGTLVLGINQALGTGVTTALSVSGGATLDLAGFALTNALSSSAGTITSSASGGLLTANNSANADFSGLLSGSLGLTKIGGGVLTLSGSTANTYTGTTTVSVGSLTLNKTAGVNAIGGDLIIGDGTSTDTVSLSAANQISDTSVVTMASSGRFNLNGNAETIGALVDGAAGVPNISLGGAALTVSGSSASSFAGNIATGTGGVLTFGGASGASMSGVLSGTGRLVKTGAGTLTLSGANTYSGGTLISEGTLQLGEGGSTGLVVGAITNNATLAVNRSDPLTMTNIVSGSGTLTKAGNGALVLSGNNTYTGATTINAGILAVTNGNAIADGAAVTLSNNVGTAFDVRGSETIGSLRGGGATGGNVTISNAAVLTVAETGNETFAGAISGGGGLTKSGGGTLRLTQANTYSGATTLAGGTLRIDNAGALGTGNFVQSSGTLLQVATTGTITNTMSIFNASFTESVTLTGAKTLNNATIDVATGETVTEQGVLSGTGGLIKVGGGAYILNGTTNNTFTGATAVSNGSLVLSNSGGNAIHSSSGITVNSGGTLVLGASNQIGDGIGLTLNGGTFLVGAATLSESLGMLTLSASSTIDFGDYGTSLRQISFADSAAITWATNAVLTITNWQGVALAQSDVTKLLFGTGGLDSDQLAQIRFADQNITGGVLVGLNGELSPIPEADIIYAALALALFILWRERRRLLHFVRSVTPPRY
jgi:fibronectin-binding autotransporter adhesin